MTRWLWSLNDVDDVEKENGLPVGKSWRKGKEFTRHDLQRIKKPYHATPTPCEELLIFVNAFDTGTTNYKD
ncbi:hypothetical protein GCM10027085_33870 [Spirosoma aerophilum]